MNLKNMIMGVINQKELLDYYNASLSYYALPKKVNGFIFYYDTVYFIILNSNLSYKKMKHTLIHEIAHIELNQLCQSNKDLFAFFIDRYEDEADEYVKDILDEIECNKDE